MKISVRFIAVLLSLGLGFTAMSQESKNAIHAEIEVLHLWRSQSEQRALHVFRDALINEGVSWLDSPVSENFMALQEEFSRRYAVGAPPSAVLWIVGENMLKLARNGIFTPIKDKDNRLKRYLLPEVYELVAMEDGLAGIPVGIHGQNFSVYNKSILERYNFEVPKTWAQLISYGPILEKDGIYLLAGSNQAWQIRTILYSILSSRLTLEEYTRLQTEGELIDDLKIKIEWAFGILRDLIKYMHPDYPDLAWEDATKLVAEGAALVQILGDYIVPEFPIIENIVCTSPPNSKYIIWGVDSFAFPKVTRKASILGQELFVKAIINKDNIIKYIKAKGGIPVIKDMQPDQLTYCHAENLKRWNGTVDRMWSGGGSWQKRLGVMGSFIKDNWDLVTKSPDIAASRLIKILNSI